MLTQSCPMVEDWLHSTAFSSGNDHFVFICTITGSLVNDGRSFGSLANLDLAIIYQTQETTNCLLRTRSLWLSSHSEVVTFWEQVAIQCPLDFALDCYRSQFVRVHCHLNVNTTWNRIICESPTLKEMTRQDQDTVLLNIFCNNSPKTDGYTESAVRWNIHVCICKRILYESFKWRFYCFIISLSLILSFTSFFLSIVIFSFLQKIKNNKKKS